MEQLQQGSGFVDSICRTCLGNLNNGQHDLFSKSGLKDKLHVCTPMTVEFGDGYPTNICHSCFLKLNDCYEFRKMCIFAMKQCFALISGHKKQNLLQLTMEEGLLAEPMTWETKVEPEEDPINEEFIHLDPQAAKIIEEALLSKKEEVDNDSDYDPQESEGCDTNNDLAESDRDQKETNKKKSNKDLLKPKHRPLVCEICDKRFNKATLLAAHKRTHEGLKPFPCTQCEKSFSKQSRLKTHVKIVHEHLGGERVECPEPGCGRSYAVKDTLRAHIREMHNNSGSKPTRPSYICEDCGKVLTSMSTLRNHRYLHTNQERPFECPQCQKRYITNHKLKEHLNRHAGVRNYICPHCGAKKTTRTELNTHINYHTKEKTYPCKFCDLVFNSIGNFGRHVRTVHEGIKNFKCKYCEKSFGKAETRKHHEMTHTGEKPHECGICHKKFIQSVSLHKHVKIHNKASINTSAKR